MSSLTSAKEDKNLKNPYSEAVKPLAEGLLRLYEPSLGEVKSHLEEISRKSSVLLDQIHEENISLAQVQHSHDLHDVFSKIETYGAKLTNIKKDMRAIHERSQKLKKRALKLQQHKEKVNSIKQQKEADLKMEQHLISRDV